MQIIRTNPYRIQETILTPVIETGTNPDHRDGYNFRKKNMESNYKQESSKDKRKDVSRDIDGTKRPDD
jgi:hypothetical protein